MWKNMNILTRLLTGFVLVALLAGLLGFIGIKYILFIDSKDTELYERMTKPLGQLTSITEDFQKVRVEMREALFAKTLPEKREHLQRVEALRQNLAKTAEAYEARITSDAMRKMFNEFKDSRKGYGEVIDKASELILDNKINEAHLLLNKEGLADVQREENAIQAMLEKKLADGKELADNNTIEANNAVKYMVIISAFIMILAIIIGYFIAKSVSNPVIKMLSAANTLALGDVNAKIDIDSSDEVGKLALAFKNVISNIQNVAHSLESVSNGTLDLKVNVLSEKDVMNQALRRVIHTLNALVAESVMLSKAAVDGKLKTRGDINKFEGGYREIVNGVNETLDAVLVPINEAADVLKEMAKGNLDVKVNGDYKGDHAMIKDAMNTTLDALNDLLSQAAAAVDQVSAGSRQISSSSQGLSQGATESAAAVEEISSSMHEMASQTDQNADNAIAANKLAVAARDNAEKGNTMMGQMVGAMKDISQSSANISKIIKVIDEIAFQTNLLALNAAVEAARAGKHGKGFTVVAEEVRNLAQRSAKAAKETTEMIEDSIGKTSVGTKFAQDTSQSLEEIVAGATKVTDLISEIAAASKEQSQGIAQINNGLGQVDQVTQQNTASSEELAAAAEELSSQAVQLKGMIEKFKLRKQGYVNYSTQNTNHQAGKSFNKKKAVNDSVKKETNLKQTPEQVIALDDDDFGKF